MYYVNISTDAAQQNRAMPKTIAQLQRVHQKTRINNLPPRTPFGNVFEQATGGKVSNVVEYLRLNYGLNIIVEDVARSNPDESQWHQYVGKFNEPNNLTLSSKSVREMTSNAQALFDMELLVREYVEYLPKLRTACKYEMTSGMVVHSDDTITYWAYMEPAPENIGKQSIFSSHSIKGLFFRL